MSIETRLPESVLVSAVCTLVGLLALPQRASATGDPCTILTPVEIEQVLGQKLAALKPAGPGLCTGTASAYHVMLRLARRPDNNTGVEDKGIAMVRQMGGQVDVKKYGPMTCSAVAPPANMVQAIGFNTTCSILKNGWVAAVELTASTRKDQVSIDKLRPLAEKMSGRF